MGKAVQDPVGICNLALSHLAIAKEIQDLVAEKSAEALACRRFYYQSRDEVLADFPWPFATAFANPALVAGPTPPATMEWAYSYRVPDDCLRVRRILSGDRNDTRDTRVPYRLTQDSSGLLILTDVVPYAATATTVAQPQIEYTVLVEDPSRFSADFAQALSYLLAWYLAPRLTAGDKFNLGKQARQAYEWAIGRARDNAVNAEQPDPLPESEFISARL